MHHGMVTCPNRRGVGEGEGEGEGQAEGREARGGHERGIGGALEGE